MKTLAPHVVVRFATEQDDLRHLLGGDLGRHTLNPGGILVAASTRGIEGMVVLFDSGHSIIFADHLKICDGAPAETGPQLILALNAYCQAMEKTAIFLVTDSIELAYLGKRRGAVVIGPMYRVRYDITQIEGAKHCA